MRRAVAQANDFRCFRPLGLRGKWSPGHAITSPQTSLKFRTAGFPRYGFKPESGLPSPSSAPPTYRRPTAPAPACLVIPALCRGKGRVRRCVPVQRPLARRRVMLSRRVIAYYGLIRASGPLPSAYDFAGQIFALRRRARRSLLCSANPSDRAVFRTPADRAANGRFDVRPS
jgi:hypothetical protein